MNVLTSRLLPEREGGVAALLPGFADVYREYAGFAFRSARALGVRPEAVDDVVQEVFVVIHKRLDGIQERSHLRAWISRIVLNVVRHHRRTGARKSPHDRSGSEPRDPDDLPNRAPDPYQAAALGERARHVQRLLDSLEEWKREILVLAEIEQLSVPEIAAALDLKLNTAYSRLRLARQAFDEALARDRDHLDGRMP